MPASRRTRRNRKWTNNVSASERLIRDEIDTTNAMPTAKQIAQSRRIATASDTPVVSIRPLREPERKAPRIAQDDLGPVLQRLDESTLRALRSAADGVVGDRAADKAARSAAAALGAAIRKLA